ncbi:DnaJ-domain-containing protein [Cristinia sonorae]|uniref:DnaJ-domain-containing protein n=1 Tax=Cristinia sonorae TaxID=1940300 RepID=A0A8K0XLC6_9AGAR|nr:DnaJ-domain-containing protein [Cristinia sonorae]
MASTEEDVSPYELLGVTLESTDQEIKTAYRQRSLKVHPDRNRGNPDAARKFHELNQAYELLLDPLRRMALDAKVRLKEAQKARYAKFDKKRKDLVADLEEREQAFKKAKVEKAEKQKEVWRENEKIMEEGRLMRERREKELLARELEMNESARKEAENARAEYEPPSLGALDTTVRLKYTLAAQATLTTPQSISILLSRFGAVDTGDVLVSLKPPPPKKPKRGTALVPFKQVGDAFAVVCASGREDFGLKDVEVTWAGGTEPELIGWLKKMGKLGTGWQEKKTESPEVSAASGIPVEAPPDTPFSSFPSTFPDLSEPVSTPAQANIPGLDYEALTLMRMRQAERERLEREIREQEAEE